MMEANTQLSALQSSVRSIEQEMRKKAAEAWQWAKECPDWDGANRHELRNRAGVYENCADALVLLLPDLRSASADGATTQTPDNNT